jgi:hypothetical protein
MEIMVRRSEEEESVDVEAGESAAKSLRGGASMEEGASQDQSSCGCLFLTFSPLFLSSPLKVQPFKEAAKRQVLTKPVKSFFSFDHG